TSRWPMISAFHHHYLVAWPDSRVVAGATRETGSGFAPHTTVSGVREVLGEALRVAPGLAGAEIREMRVGLRPLTADTLPVLGPGHGVVCTTGGSQPPGTAAMRFDPADPKKQAPNNQVTVIDIKANPPKVLATLEAGKGAAGLSINRAGTLALVSNLVDGTVSVFTIQGKTVTAAGTVDVGGEKAGGGMVAITPDGKTALVSRSNDHKVSVLSIEGSKVEYTKRDMLPGQRPIVLDIA